MKTMKELNHHDLVARTIVDQVDQLIKNGHELEAIEAIHYVLIKLKKIILKLMALSAPRISIQFQKKRNQIIQVIKK